MAPKMAPKKPIVLGLHPYRFTDNPEEKRFAVAWDTYNRQGHTLAYLLNPKPGLVWSLPPDPDHRDVVVAATVVQWLGSHVGESFLAELGYVKARK